MAAAPPRHERSGANVRWPDAFSLWRSWRWRSRQREDAREPRARPRTPRAMFMGNGDGMQQGRANGEAPRAADVGRRIGEGVSNLRSVGRAKGSDGSIARGVFDGAKRERVQRPRDVESCEGASEVAERGIVRLAGTVRTTKLRHSRRSGTWPAIKMFEFHKPVNCPARRLLPAAPGSAEK
jgi:hypothetical protein